VSSRKERKRLAREARQARELADRAAAASRRRRVLASTSAAVALATAAALIAILGSLASGSRGAAARLGAEGVPVPAAADLAKAGGAPRHAIDGISCLGAEQLAFHIHAHLTLVVNGRARRVPYGIGIRDPEVERTTAGAFVGGGSCFFWLHTHAADGIIHIESPVARTYMLGEFFDVWGQPLGPSQVGPARGPVRAIDNGRIYRGDPRNLPLTAHAQVELEVGRPLVAPESITFPGGL
jgi:hypothetical protein